MRKKIIVSATLALLLVLIAGSACAAYCTACGVSISDSAHLCPRCGARQMPSSSALTITRVFSNGDGTVTVNWSGGVGPFEILSVPLLSSSIHRDLENPACPGLQPAAACTFDGHSGLADRLVPGQEAWIIVRDAKGRLDYHAHTSGEAAPFTDFPVDVTLQLRGLCGDDRTEYAAFPASGITAAPDDRYGADVLLTYPALVSGRDFKALVCITAPNGAVMTYLVTDVLLPGDSSSFPFGFHDMTAYFSLLEERFSGVPSGMYTWSLYFDGMYVSSQTFRITN